MFVKKTYPYIEQVYFYISQVKRKGHAMDHTVKISAELIGANIRRFKKWNTGPVSNIILA